MGGFNLVRQRKYHEVAVSFLPVPSAWSTPPSEVLLILLSAESQIANQQQIKLLIVQLAYIVRVQNI